MAPSPPPREPETLAELGAMILRMVARGFVWKLALGAGIFLAVWIFHTFVLVYINEGFWASSSGSFWSSWLGRLGIRGFLQAPLVKALVSTTDAILATRGQRTLPIVLIWMLAPSLITGALVRMKVMGFRTWLSNVLTTPAWVSKTLRSAEPSPLTLPLFLFSAAIGLGAAVAFGAPAFLGNRPLVFVAALHGLSALAARLATFTVLVTRVTWNDIQRVALPRRPRRPLNPLHLLLVHLGLTAGLTAGALLPWLTVLGTLGIFVAVAAGTAVLVISLTRGRGPGRPGGPLVLLLLVMVLTAAVAIPVWADDGGWQEAGGTFTSWVKSQGAGPAVVAGVIPSLAAAAGALLGALASAVASAVAGIGAGAASAAAGAVAGAAATGAGGAASSTAGGGSPPAAGAGTAAAGPPGAAPPVTGTPAQPPPGATMPPTEKMPVVPPVPPPEPTPPEPPGKAKAEPKQPPQKKEPEPQKKTKEKPQPEPTQHQDDKEKPEPEKAKEEKPQPEPKKHEQKPPVKPKKKEGYLAGLWRRAKGAAKSVAGAVSATAQAAKDIYNDPSLITETAKNIGHEVKETAKAAADVGK
ncbi:MAG TPA: hypothetical protein ENK19_02490 [Acidobacteria bacterium]|nr:hypothetical protein [Acidobacteriota bacterium]